MSKRAAACRLIPGRSAAIWCAAAAGYVVIQAGRRGGLVHGQWDWHAADLLCLPLILGLVLVAQRWRDSDPRFTLPRWHGFLAAVLYAGYFEGVLPRFSQHAVADPGDVACYFLGWILFELLLNRPPKKEPRSADRDSHSRLPTG